jgi:DNA replication protein DnaC
MNEPLSHMLRTLRLSGLAETLEVRLHEASANRLSHTEFLELILQDEMLVRDQRKIARRVKSASFRDLKSLEEFDWNFNPSIKKSQIYELASGQFIKERRDVLLCSAPGTGKSHLIQGIGYHLIKQGYVVWYRSIFDVVRDFLHDEAMDGHDRVISRYLKPDLLIIDDFGMKQLAKRSGEFLFEIVMRRYETRSTMMTTNRPLEDWGKLLQDVPTATAILDRFLHHAEIITIEGHSYRLRNRNQASNGAKAPTGSSEPKKTSKRAKAPTGSKTENKSKSTSKT